MNERNDTGHVTVLGEETFGGVVYECRSDDCDQHYVVRLDGTWVRGFHNEREAYSFADDMRSLINH